jgi:propanediol dehydratase small subunit
MPLAPPVTSATRPEKSYAFTGGCLTTLAVARTSPGALAATDGVPYSLPVELDPARDYPLGARRPDLVVTPSGMPQEEITLAALVAGRLEADDIRATSETLRAQAAVAANAGRHPLAASLTLAAELASVPNDVLLEIYTALRPRRATAPVLEQWAGRLDAEFEAPQAAAFVREAAEVYEARGLLALDERALPPV